MHAFYAAAAQGIARAAYRAHTLRPLLIPLWLWCLRHAERQQVD